MTDFLDDLDEAATRARKEQESGVFTETRQRELAALANPQTVQALVTVARQFKETAVLLHAARAHIGFTFNNCTSVYCVKNREALTALESLGEKEEGK